MANEQNLKPFKKGESGNPNGRPKGSISLETRVKRLLEEPDKLPKAIQQMIGNICEEGTAPIDALLIAAYMNGLQGDTKAMQIVLERGWGKVPNENKNEHTGDITIRWGGVDSGGEEE